MVLFDRESKWRVATDFQGFATDLYGGLVGFLGGLKLSCRSFVLRFHARLENRISLQFEIPFAS
jgi:hypothetical protein